MFTLKPKCQCHTVRGVRDPSTQPPLTLPLTLYHILNPRISPSLHGFPVNVKTFTLKIQIQIK